MTLDLSMFFGCGGAVDGVDPDKGVEVVQSYVFKMGCVLICYFMTIIYIERAVL